MVGSGEEKNEEKQTTRQKLKFYVTFTAASVGKTPPILNSTKIIR